MDELNLPPGALERAADSLGIKFPQKDTAVLSERKLISNTVSKGKNYHNHFNPGEKSHTKDKKIGIPIKNS